MKTKIQTLGSLGESIACIYLKRKGYRILDRNIQNKKGYKYGEIDIVAKDGEMIVFAEVKTRSIQSEFNDSVFPEERISLNKLRSLEKMAHSYLKDNFGEKGLSLEYRFDAVSIRYDHSCKKAFVRHLEHIFL